MTKYKKLWKNFLAFDIEECKSSLSLFLEKKTIKGKWMENTGSWVLSNKKGYSFSSDYSVRFRLSLMKATASPFERFLINFTGNSHRLENVCFIIIETEDKEGFQKLKTLLAEYFDGLDKKPWDLKSHPMFQFAWLLRLNVKKRWKSFLTLEN